MTAIGSKKTGSTDQTSAWAIARLHWSLHLLVRLGEMTGVEAWSFIEPTCADAAFASSNAHVKAASDLQAAAASKERADASPSNPKLQAEAAGQSQTAAASKIAADASAAAYVQASAKLDESKIPDFFNTTHIGKLCLEQIAFWDETHKKCVISGRGHDAAGSKTQYRYLRDGTGKLSPR